ncbi:MAG: phosphohistidine phosphatase SixA [FCB group bacterium]|nr:phosphohistidine phosphatase SixA [FCB group bacterium]
MKLYLVQHGEAAVRQGESERSLTEKGISNLLKMTAFMDIHAGFSVGAIYHSGILRARQTAEILAEHIKPPVKLQETDGLAPMAQPEIWAERLREMNEDTMLVGHMPHMSRLPSYLVTGNDEAGVVMIHNGGITCLSRDPGGHWSVVWVVTPNILK